MWDNPQVQQFVGVWNHLLQIRHDLPPLATSASPTVVRRLDFGAHDGGVELGPDPLERYRALDNVTRAAFLILGEGLPSTLGNGLTRPRTPQTIAHALNAALRSYGLKVIPAPEQALRPGPVPKER